MKKILVCGGGGFIGNHLVASLKAQGHWVVSADLRLPKFDHSPADEFKIVDLRDPVAVAELIRPDIDEIYQLAADMGGAAFIFTGHNDADIMHNSAQINLNILNQMVQKKIPRVFYASSACIYPERNQLDPKNPRCVESSAYPADPDSEYGWEKLFSERLYGAFARCHGIDVRIARFHNVYGPGGAYTGGREKSPAALCRKVAESTGTVEVWGDGQQTRSFLYIDQCIEGIHRLMAADYDQPVNIGSDRQIAINDLVTMIAGIAGRSVRIVNIAGPEGVRGRNSDNTLIQRVLGWAPSNDLEHGMRQTYAWIAAQIEARKRDV